MLRRKNLRRVGRVVNGLACFSRSHPALVLLAVVLPFTTILLSSCEEPVDRDADDPTQNLVAEHDQGTLTELRRRRAASSARDNGKAPDAEPPHVLLGQARDQLDAEIDRFINGLEDAACGTAEMAEIRSLRRVYGTTKFLHELDLLLNRSDKSTLSPSQRAEYKRLCDRWTGLEQLMLKMALTQE